jgi:hypothetical protein
MKKVIVILSILFSVKCVGQDTSIYQMRNEFYMVVRQPLPKDNPLVVNYMTDKKRINRRIQNQAVFAISMFIFGSMTIWYVRGLNR